MTPERWQKVDEIFQAAIELNAEMRRAFVESVCVGDDELQREVEALITADDQGFSFIDEPAFQVASSLLVTDEPVLAEGQSLGHYEIEGLIGKGGMGEVYLAKDKLLNRCIALKVLPADYTKNEDRLKRFQQEAQAASALNHPNIITIYQLGEADGRQFIATEFVEGETLRHRLKRGQLKLSEALEITIQIGNALSAAHRVGIVHRDIKPENIMLRPDGYVKVLDFGLAKLTEQHESTTRSRVAEDVNISSGLVMGTVKYMSPEQARGQQVDPRSDIFSFGIVLHEMLTGHAPFQGESAGNVIKSILKERPPRLEEYLADAPGDLQFIVDTALAKNKSRRYQTAKDLVVALRTLTPREGAKLQTSTYRIDGRMVSTEGFVQRTALSIRYVTGWIKKHKATATLMAAMFVAAIVGINPLQISTIRWYDANQSLPTIVLPCGRPQASAFDGRYIWVTAGGECSAVYKFNTIDGDLIQTVSGSLNNPSGIAYDGSNIWVANSGSNSVTKISARSGAVLTTISVGHRPQGVTYDGNDIWVANIDDSTVSKLRVSDGTVLTTISTGPIGSNPQWMAFDGTSLWVSNFLAGNVIRIRTSDGTTIGTYVAGSGPAQVAFDGANIWVANNTGGGVTKLNGKDGSTLGIYSTGSYPVGVVFDGTSIWVSNAGNSTVTKLRLSDGLIIGTYPTGSEPQYLGFDGIHVWIPNSSGFSLSRQ